MNQQNGGDIYATFLYKSWTQYCRLNGIKELITRSAVDDLILRRVSEGKDERKKAKWNILTVSITLIQISCLLIFSDYSRQKM